MNIQITTQNSASGKTKYFGLLFDGEWIKCTSKKAATTLLNKIDNYVDTICLNSAGFQYPDVGEAQSIPDEDNQSSLGSGGIGGCQTEFELVKEKYVASQKDGFGDPSVVGRNNCTTTLVEDTLAKLDRHSDQLGIQAGQHRKNAEQYERDIEKSQQASREAHYEFNLAVQLAFIVTGTPHSFYGTTRERCESEIHEFESCQGSFLGDYERSLDTTCQRIDEHQITNSKPVRYLGASSPGD